MFSFWSFIDLGFTVRSMICFELIFGYDVKYRQKFNFFSTCIFNSFSTISWKDCILSTKLRLYSCQKSVAHVCGSIYGFFILFHWSFFFILMPILYHTLLVTIALWWVLKSDGVSPLTLFWMTFLPSHQKTKLECMWRVLVLVLCLVRDLRESPKAIVLHPRHLCLVLTAVLETPETLSPNQSESSGHVLWPESRSRCPRKRWSLGHSDDRDAHDSPGLWVPWVLCVGLW